jgi:hypothetical protein
VHGFAGNAFALARLRRRRARRRDRDPSRCADDLAQWPPTLEPPGDPVILPDAVLPRGAGIVATLGGLAPQR